MKGATHILTGLIALASLSLTTLAHDHDEHGKNGEHGEGMHTAVPSSPTGTDNASFYFVYAPHRGWLILHILTMILGWVVLMPLCISSSTSAIPH
jgi:hypothetical protein